MTDKNLGAKLADSRMVYTCILLVVAAFTLYEELSLRRYLFRNHITTLYLADSLPNFLASVLLIFAVVIVKNPATPAGILRISISVIAGLVLYEIAQIWMPHMVFDIKDIIASVLGGAFAFGIIYWINKR